MKSTDHTNPKTRRNFLETTAKVAGTGALLSAFPFPISAYAGAVGEIKVALVGCGGRGTGAAAQAIEADSDVRLVAMADVFGDRLENSYQNLSKKIRRQRKNTCQRCLQIHRFRWIQKRKS